MRLILQYYYYIEHIQCPPLPTLEKLTDYHRNKRTFNQNQQNQIVGAVPVY